MTSNTPGINYTDYSREQRPGFIKDFLEPEVQLPGGITLDTAGFVTGAGSVTLASAVAEDETSNAVVALPQAIPANTVITFTGGGKLITSAAHAAGATTLNHYAAATVIADATAGTFDLLASTVGAVPAGTLVSRTYAERAAGDPFHKAVASDDEFYLTIYDTPATGGEQEAEVLRHHALIAEEFLPGWGDANIWTAGLIADMRANYQTVAGAD